MKFSVLIIALASLAGCSTHEVDTFPEWCEQIGGIDLEEKYAPSWSVIFGVSFDAEAIRDNYTDFLNQSHLQKVENRTDRMVWREGGNLHLVNLSSFFVIEPQRVISEWESNIRLSNDNKLKAPADACLYGTLTSMFDTLTIHSMEADALGVKWTDHPTEISTGRVDRLGNKRL